MSDLRLEEIVQKYRQLGDAAFRNAYPHPMLVRRDARDGESEVAFHTAFMSRDMLRQTSELGQPDTLTDATREPGQQVLKVAKRAGGPFQDRIGIGRARNADVSLPLPRVSKYHGYFSWSLDGSEYFVTDAGSKNGTSVGGSLVPAKQAVPVSNGTEISFGPYRFLFYTPDGFADLIASRAR
ncbi:MAG: FHA domain-containing protein [Myxococcales bacterium]|nr:FHA domain-containing protein [Myxococcales bacterium]